DRGSVLYRLSAGVSADAPAPGAGAAAGLARAVDAVDARRLARQRDLAGESLPAGHVGDRDRRARCVAGGAFAHASGTHDRLAGLAGCDRFAGDDDRRRADVASAARRLHVAAGALGAVPAAGLRATPASWRLAPLAGTGLAALVGAAQLRDLSQPHVRGVRGGAPVQIRRRRPAAGFPVVLADAAAVLVAGCVGGALVVVAVRALAARQVVADPGGGATLAGERHGRLMPLRRRWLRRGHRRPQCFWSCAAFAADSASVITRPCARRIVFDLPGASGLRSRDTAASAITASRAMITRMR